MDTYLIGFSGVGKSTVAKNFADTNGWDLYRYVDVNDWLLDKYNRVDGIKPARSIKEMMKLINVKYVTDKRFKILESDAFTDGVDQITNHTIRDTFKEFIIATNATTPIHCKIPENSLVVYLRTTFGDILDNLSHNEMLSRPIFDNMNKARELFTKCDKVYKSIANITIDTAYLSIDDIVELISLKRIKYEKGEL